METELEAVNGRRVRAIEVFAHALRFFREHALKVRLAAAGTVFISRGVASCVFKRSATFRSTDSASGGEGPVLVCPGGRGDQMGDHRPRRVEATRETVHERGCIPGRNHKTHQ